MLKTILVNKSPEKLAMDRLRKLQNTFQDFVLGSKKSTNYTWVSAKGRAVPKTQLSIYSYAYAARLREVLENDFPALLMALGENAFHQLANSYIETHPSHNFSLRDFGRQLPDFLADCIKNNAEAQNTRWQHELAIFEWTLGQAFDAADANLFNEQDMANIAHEHWPSLKFIVHPSVHRLDFEWNTVEMWQALTADEVKPVTASSEPTSAWIIWREQLTTRFRSMQDNEQHAFDTLRNNGSFNDICESIASLVDEEQVPLQAATYIKSWISYGLIAGVE